MIQAIYEDGVLKPLERLSLGEHEKVQLTVEPLASPQAAEDEVEEELIREGALSVPSTLADPTAFQRWKPVTIAGKPVSQTIIEERR
jgi:predicted DNA-binding antitoxin AbrB/MazE fold protein